MLFLELSNNIDAKTKLKSKNLQRFIKKKKILFQKRGNFNHKSNNDFFLVILGKPTDINDNIVGLEEIFKKIVFLKKKKLIINYFKTLCGAFNIILYFPKKNFFLVFKDKDGFMPLFIFKRDNKKITITDSLIFLKKNELLEVNHKFLKKYIFYRYNYIYGGKEFFFKNLTFIPAATYTEVFFTKIIIKQHSRKNIKINNKQKYEIAKKKIFELSLNLFKKKKSLYTKKTILALSGGLDSSSAAFFLSKVNKKIPSFTASYSLRSKLNETSEAKSIAKLYSSKWFKITIDDKKFLNTWKNIYKKYSTPLPSSSSLGYHILYEKIKDKGFNKILNVGSPDHYFLGNYPAFLYYLSDLYFTKKNNFKNELNSWIKFHSTKEFPKTLNIFKKFFNKNILKKRNKFIINPKSEILFKSEDMIKTNLGKFSNSSFINAYLEMCLYHSERAPGLVAFDELTHTTKVSTEDPFIGEKIRNFCYSLPTHFKIQKGVGKYILRDLMKKHLPQKILNFKGKIGFDLPFKNWMYEDKNINDFILNIFIDNKKNSIIRDLDMNKIISLFKKKKLNAMFVWQLSNSIMWMKQNKS